jgi:phosphate acetyltransferase
MNPSSIFIAATGQNVGKTTLCLGILAALRKRYGSVGFIKPVGQLHVKVDEEISVDKDVLLFKKHFQLPENWEDMSPVMVPPGVTRNFLDGNISSESLLQKITTSYRKIREANQFTLVEGTGHVGVGSIIQLNNARVAKELGTEIVIIASGGLGSAFDELSLNISLCQQYGVKVRGVILNRVKEDKRDMILEYFPRALKQWNIPLIGCLPYSDFLSNPTIRDFENLFDDATLLSGESHRYRHFSSFRLVAGSLDSYTGELDPNELVITPASREDIIEATIDRHRTKEFTGGMILTSRPTPSVKILEKIRKVDLPIIYAPLCSYDAMKMITSFTAKIRVEDTLKVEKAIHLVEAHLDFDLLCQSS